MSGAHIITGGNRGLGLACAHALRAVTDDEIVLAVRCPDAAAAVARAVGGATRVEALDLADFASIDRFCARWRGPIASLLHNAGVQFTTGTERTAAGLERTFAVNYLAAVGLTAGLAAQLAGSRVVFVGSGTHDPDNPMAKMSGFRGARFESIAASARGGGETRQAGLDAYATSKLLCMLAARALAARVPEGVARFYAIDPGMMPGTGLARAQPAPLRFVWRYVLPLLAWALPDTGSTRRAARAIAGLLTMPDVPFEGGTTMYADGAPLRRSSPQATDDALARRVLDETLALLGELGQPVAPLLRGSAG